MFNAKNSIILFSYSDNSINLLFTRNYTSGLTFVTWWSYWGLEETISVARTQQKRKKVVEKNARKRRAVRARREALEFEMGYVGPEEVVTSEGERSQEL